jgi:hypothetical protein
LIDHHAMPKLIDAERTTLGGLDPKGAVRSDGGRAHERASANARDGQPVDPREQRRPPRVTFAERRNGLERRAGGQVTERFEPRILGSALDVGAQLAPPMAFGTRGEGEITIELAQVEIEQRCSVGDWLTVNRRGRSEA